MVRQERMAKNAIPPPINTTTMLMPVFPLSSSAGLIVATAVGTGSLVTVAAGALVAVANVADTPTSLSKTGTNDSTLRTVRPDT